MARKKKQTKALVRTEDGKFLPGVSGNPAGRPPGTRNMIVAMKHDLEVAVRQALPVAKIQAIVDKLADLALDGNVSAAKLLLDKTVSNASGAEEAPEQGKTYVFRVDVMPSLMPTSDIAKTPTLPALDGQFEEIQK